MGIDPDCSFALSMNLVHIAGEDFAVGRASTRSLKYDLAFLADAECPLDRSAGLDRPQHQIDACAMDAHMIERPWRVVVHYDRISAGDSQHGRDDGPRHEEVREQETDAFKRGRSELLGRYIGLFGAHPVIPGQREKTDGQQCKAEQDDYGAEQRQPLLAQNQPEQKDRHPREHGDFGARGGDSI